MSAPAADERALLDGSGTGSSPTARTSAGARHELVALAAGATATPEDLIGYAREHLAHFTCPTRVELVETLPRNATGKVLKTDLRARYGSDSRAVSR